MVSDFLFPSLSLSLLRFLPHLFFLFLVFSGPRSHSSFGPCVLTRMQLFPLCAAVPYTHRSRKQLPKLKQLTLPFLISSERSGTFRTETIQRGGWRGSGRVFAGGRNNYALHLRAQKGRSFLPRLLAPHGNPSSSPRPPPIRLPGRNLRSPAGLSCLLVDARRLAFQGFPFREEGRHSSVTRLAFQAATKESAQCSRFHSMLSLQRRKGVQVHPDIGSARDQVTFHIRGCEGGYIQMPVYVCTTNKCW